ncbi:MAG: peptidoglycan DD-metalloendopeptidase family protein [Gammaproteobacteria bacterium]
MRAAAVALMLLAAGCAGSSRSIIDYPARVHIVQPGETLYGIAWRYGVDYRDLARWNRIDDPNFIRVGQRILLTPPASDTTAASAGTGNAARPASQPASTSATRSPGSAATPPRTAAAPPRNSGTPSSNAAPRSPSAAAPSSSSTPAPASPPPRWHWPTSGQVVSRFGSSEGGLSTGIAIAGREGQAIEAAADGRVVYAGTGLIGYGQLLIIRHNDTYLTAYGYNRRLLVEQGDEVKRGQKIAEMGLNPARQPRLHFEVRRNGVPVDPLTLMSPR